MKTIITLIISIFLIGIVNSIADPMLVLCIREGSTYSGNQIFGKVLANNFYIVSPHPTDSRWVKINMEDRQCDVEKRFFADAEYVRKQKLDAVTRASTSYDIQQAANEYISYCKAMLSWQCYTVDEISEWQSKYEKSISALVAKVRYDETLRAIDAQNRIAEQRVQAIEEQSEKAEKRARRAQRAAEEALQRSAAAEESARAAEERARNAEERARDGW